ncbi:hypothetical protein FSP39_002697 [Pinctada imbricata]|uniref:Vertnin n=1 Tax=Pinctada imbricata TaxID=66713 RepID=A0AA88XPK2_PINIB|nr:hypothetical protein FSP39_002697 [Pinctada imbricata]
MRFLPKQVESSNTDSSQSLIKDSIASEFLGNNSNYFAVETTGNGNCLFNALSLALQNNESLSLELRFRTTLEMILHRSFFERDHLHDRLFDVSPSYDDAMRACATNFSFSNAFTMHAASSVIGKPIRSVYPTLHGILDNTIGILNRFFKPRSSNLQKNEITILWSNSSPFSGTGIWTPNHFVLLLPRSSNISFIDISSEIEFPTLSSPTLNKRNPTDDSLIDETLTHDLKTDETMTNDLKTDETLTNDLKTDETLTHDLKTDETLTHDLKTDETKTNDLKTDETLTHDLNVTEDEVVFVRQPFRNPDVNGLDGKFLNSDETLKVITTFDSENVHKHVPQGHKENVFFLVENAPDNNKRSFVDDCGVWFKNSRKTAYFIKNESGQLKPIFKKGDNFLREIKGKMVLLDPQPSLDKVLVLQRYYSKLKKNPIYQRRVSWFEHLSGHEDKLSVSIFEYIGEYPGESIHGNTKSDKTYKRPTIEQKKIISEGLKHGKAPIQISKDLNKFDPENLVDLKVIQNAKYKRDKAAKPNSTSSNNIADEVQSILSSLPNNTFVRSLIANNDGRPPNIVCYTDDQLDDMRQCMTNGAIIGIDRTFNLGQFYVTCLCYQHPNLIRHGTNTSPIMLGAVFLHSDGSYATYCDFLSKIRSALGFHIQTEKIVFGTDEEYALINAIKTVFPTSEHILCTRHLKENAQRNLASKNVDEKIRNQIVNSIFGPCGILTTESRISFLEREQEICEKFGNAGGNYLKEKLLPTLREKIFLPSIRNENIPSNWKNNNCESMNHKIKLLGDWKMSKLPNLIERLLEIQETQVIEIRGALHGRGNLHLASHAQHLRICHNAWLDLSDDQRNKVFRKFLKFRIQDVVESSDGKLNIPIIARIAKKPGQVKRVRSAKTTSVPKKPKVTA